MLTLFLYMFGGIALLGALGTILNRHPIASAMSLVLSFLAVASIYALLDAHLLAAIQVIVYVGAIMVFIVYTILLMDLQDEDMLGVLSINRLLPVALGLVWVSALWMRVGDFPLMEAPVVDPSFGTVSEVAMELFTRYIYVFELIGILLLAGIVGALVLAMRSDESAAAGGEEQA